MIEFIVLGHIPGTSIYLQFNSVVLFGAFIFSLGLARAVFTRTKNNKQTLKQMLDISI